MDKISTYLRRYFILNKRLLKRVSFLVILLLVPISVLTMNVVAANSDSGVVTVALAMQDDSDPLANEIVSELLGDSGLIRFEYYETVLQAREALEGGRVDAAWIFSGDMESKIEKFVAHTHKNNAFVVVLQREDNVMLRLSCEKLNMALYPHISLALCQNYIYEHILTLEDLSEERLREYYDSVDAEGEDLFEFVYTDGTVVENNKSNNYLTAPLRGFMSIMVVLSGLAVAMYYKQDELRGTFDRMPHKRRFSFMLSYHATAVLTTALVMFVTLLLVGMASFTLGEMISVLLYCAVTVGFCVGVGLLLKDIRLLGTVTPILVVVMTVLCPVFFNFVDLPAVQFLLPPYYYLNTIYSSRYIWCMVIYAVALYGFDYVLYRLQRK